MQSVSWCTHHLWGGVCGQSIENFLLISNPVLQMMAPSFLLSIGYDGCEHVCVLFSNFELKKSYESFHDTPSIQRQSL